MVLQCYLASDASLSSKRPGVMVVHKCYGYNEYVPQRARQLVGTFYLDRQIMRQQRFSKIFRSSYPSKASGSQHLKPQ